ncbi:MAG TPA: phosphodiester glycosidase family protein [Armatimonadota bacterium]|nr:phosphodiester glycosidase family protein [Armatimonadota bacterium]
MHRPRPGGPCRPDGRRLFRRGLWLEAGGHPRLKRQLLLLSTLLLLAPAAGRALAAEPVTYSRRSVGGVQLHLIDVDLNDRRVVVSPAIAARGLGRTEDFSSFVRRLRPAAAINGTFFGKRNLKPVADILIDGKLVSFGGIGTAAAFAPDGVDFIRLPKSRHVDWSDHRAALAGGPLLVWDGFAKPLPGGEGFRDPAVFARAAPRTALGITKDNHLLLVTTARGTSLTRLARAMRDLGIRYAFNLDGGGSAGMWYKDRMIVRPERSLTNILCIYLKPEPVSSQEMRPPRGLDWRSGHQPRPMLHFAAGDLRVSAALPREWSGRQSVTVSADKPLPDGWRVSVRLDDQPVAVAVALPADLEIDLSGLSGPKHQLWIEILDDQGKAVGRTERIFKPGTAGHHAW